MLIRKNNLRLYYTSLSLPLKITIALRWNPGKDVVKKAAECAGKACNDFLKSSAANTAVNAPDDSATPPPVSPHPMPKGPTSDPATLLVKPPGKDLLDTMPPSIKTGHVTSLKENVLGKEVSQSCTKMDLTNPAFDNLKKMVINYPTPNQSDKSQEPSTSTSVSEPHGVVQTSQGNSETINTTSSEISLIEDALKLGLLKYTDAPDNPHGGHIQMTKEGNTVFRQLTRKELPEESSSGPIDLSKITFQVVTVTMGANTSIPRPDQIHPVISTENGKILAWGYLTSNETEGTFEIADKQISGDKKPNGSFKPQYFKPFEQPVEISSDQYEYLNEGTDYAKDPKIAAKLKLVLKKASTREPIPYKETGVTKEDLEVMIAAKLIDKSEKAYKDAKADPFGDKAKKKIKAEETAKTQQNKQKKESQEKKAKAKAEAEIKQKLNNDT